jgi:hypothetical protein
MPIPHAIAKYIDTKSVVSAGIGALLAAMAAYGIFIVKETVAQQVYMATMERAQSRLDQIVSSHAKVEERVDQINELKAKCKNDAESVTANANEVKIDAAVIRTMRESIGSIRGDEIARSIVSDVSMKEQIVTSVVNKIGGQLKHQSFSLGLRTGAEDGVGPEHIGRTRVTSTMQRKKIATMDGTPKAVWIDWTDHTMEQRRYSHMIPIMDGSEVYLDLRADGDQDVSIATVQVHVLFLGR